MEYRVGETDVTLRSETANSAKLFQSGSLIPLEIISKLRKEKLESLLSDGRIMCNEKALGIENKKMPESDSKLDKKGKKTKGGTDE